MMSVSVVLSCFRRAQLLYNTLQSIREQGYSPLQLIVVEDGYDGGGTSAVATRFEAEYYCRRNRPDGPGFQNPARIHNIGIRKAKNDIVILQGGEVRWTQKDGIRQLIQPIEERCGHTVSTFPLCRSLDPQGHFLEWYMHPREGERSGWQINFCQAASRKALLNIGGFDEDFTGYGHEDDDFEFRLRRSGVEFQWAPNVTVEHQWHTREKYDCSNEAGKNLANDKRRRIEMGEKSFTANEGREWGKL